MSVFSKQPCITKCYISPVYFKSQSKQQEKTNQYSYTYKPNISKLKCKIILVFVSNHKALDISLKILDSKVGNNIEYFTGNILKILDSKVINNIGYFTENS